MENLLKVKLSHARVIIIILVAIVAFLIFGIYSWFQKNREFLEPSFIPQFPLEKKTGIKQIPVDELPRLIYLMGIPLEQSAQVLQNYSQITADKEQATRIFISKWDLWMGFEFYKKYLKDAGWIVVNTIDGTDIKSISTRKGTVFMSITMSKNKQTDQNVVDVTVVGSPTLGSEAGTK